MNQNIVIDNAIGATTEIHEECGLLLADHCTDCDECPRTVGPCWCFRDVDLMDIEETLPTRRGFVLADVMDAETIAQTEQYLPLTRRTARSTIRTTGAVSLDSWTAVDDTVKHTVRGPGESKGRTYKHLKSAETRYAALVEAERAWRKAHGLAASAEEVAFLRLVDAGDWMAVRATPWEVRQCGSRMGWWDMNCRLTPAGRAALNNA